MDTDILQSPNPKTKALASWQQRPFKYWRIMKDIMTSSRIGYHQQDQGKRRNFQMHMGRMRKRYHAGRNAPERRDQSAMLRPAATTMNWRGASKKKLRQSARVFRNQRVPPERLRKSRSESQEESLLLAMCHKHLLRAMKSRPNQARGHAQPLAILRMISRSHVWHWRRL